MRSFLAAVGLFTILPAPVLTELDRTWAARAMRAFPVLGLLLGGVAGACAWGVQALGGGGFLAAMIALCIVAGVTGAMHLDGIADTADGLGSRKSAEDALRIMKQSDIGPMGVVTLVLVLLLEAGALASPGLGGVRTVAALAIACMLGRLTAMESTGTWVPCARPGGFGSYFAQITTPVALGLECAAIAVGIGAAGWLLSAWIGVAVWLGSAVAAATIGWAWRRHAVSRLGGITGDVIGSVIEVTQAAFLVIIALAV